MCNERSAGLRGRSRCDSKPLLEAMPEDLMWNPTTRTQHSRAGLRYGSDVTDREWALLVPMLPAEAACGRRRAWPMREVINAIFYVLRTGCPWRMLPEGFPPYTTV